MHIASKQRCINVDATERRRIDVDTTLFEGCVSAGLEEAPAFVVTDKIGRPRRSNFGFEIVKSGRFR